MDDDELHAQIAELEADLTATVADQLAAVHAEYTAGLDNATELVAARFSVSSIRGMWQRHVPGLLRRLLGIGEQAATVAADDVGEELPDGWDDLPGRYDHGTLPPQLGDYVNATTGLLNAVGDRLAAAATQALADGLNAGEDTEQLRARLLDVFTRDGTQLGHNRAELIAQTEATRVWNAATLAAAQAVTGPDKPLVKQWRTRGDQRVRSQHADVDGQLQLLDEPFQVADVPMQYPGAPDAPPNLTIRCRCVMRLSPAPQTASAALPKETPMDTATAAADGEHTGAMIALVPSEADAGRLALDGDGAEPADELHLTLWFLGDAAPWTEDQRNELIGLIRARAGTLGPVHAYAFGVNHWNPASEDPAWVWAIGDDTDASDDAATLHEARNVLAVDALESTHERPDTPFQHSPWVAHTTGAYSTGQWPMEQMTERLGPITFDRVRIAFGGEHTDIPLGDRMRTAAMTEPTPEPPLLATWSTPGDTALAFEDQETGDGRIFTPGALTWTGGPWPLQYADEMQGGHDGARLAGAIADMTRQGGRIAGHGVLYLTTDAGVEAGMLLAQGAPLGVSVDLDDVDIELVDKSGDGPAEEDWVEPYRAHLLTASLLPLADGGWSITGETATEWTASGTSLAGESRRVTFHTDADGSIPADAFELTAAAGDPDTGGVVVDAQRAGEYIMRITRGRIRGATLVSIPAYADARIVLDQPELFAAAETVTAAAAGSDYERVVRHVRKSLVPVSAADAARFLKLPVEVVRRYLAKAAKEGEIVRLTRGNYTRANEEVSAAATGEEDQQMTELEASAWAAMKDLPPMPASWFREPTAEELPPGGAGVNYAGGRIFGWVAQAGEPHAGYAKKVTIDGLGRIDTTHFLRQRFTLDDGSTVKAGAFTMNAGHHADGAECETASCQFDDSRFVAGIVTVGMNERGMWFSGAAAPWLSEWDRSVFMSCQPSYHMKKGANGQWQLRAVLSVPVPGHSSPLLASAVAERSQLALTAAAAIAEVEPQHDRADTVPAEAAPSGAADPVETLTAALLAPQFLDRFSAALTSREVDRERERAELAALVAEAELIGEEIAASAYPDDETITSEGN